MSEIIIPSWCEFLANAFSSFTGLRKNTYPLNVSENRVVKKTFFFEKERFRSKWKKTVLQHFFKWKHKKGTEEIFHSEMQLIVFQKSLAKRKIFHFPTAKSVSQLGMREAHGTETPLHGFPNPNFLPWVDIWIWKKNSPELWYLKGVLKHNNPIYNVDRIYNCSI